VLSGIKDRTCRSQGIEYDLDGAALDAITQRRSAINHAAPLR
jgi:hypothetical protein